MSDRIDIKASLRSDHPRLFLNTDTFPAIKERALGICREHYEKLKAFAEGPPAEREWAAIDRPAPMPDGTEVRDWGHQMMGLAFVQLVEPTEERLRDILSKLRASAEYFHACYAENESVNWYAASRAACLVALDWLWNDLSPEDRNQIGLRLLDHVDEALHKPDIARRNGSDYKSGFYGAPSLAWFAGLVLHGEGVDDERAAAYLERGYDDHMNLLAHRDQTSGLDGGEAAPTLGYSFGEYPLAEWNFIHTLLSATDQNIAPDWPYICRLPNYILWNWLPDGLEFGYGDTPHIDNKITRGWLYTHMCHIMHLYGKSHSQWAGLARYVRDMAGGKFSPERWPIYPFLLTELENAPPVQNPGVLPPARNFQNMGQIFMRTGDGPDDTYALFACGGTLKGHRHYDATHFTIFKHGYLALDSGTRQGNTDNLQNYFAQTVAHNCILIKMPGEPPSPYWNGDVFGQAGGQDKTVGSTVLAFETSPDFTYIAADATPTYNAEKCEFIVRQFVFLPPDHFVVFDRVVSTNADFAKTWMLHHANEPVVDGNTWRSDQDRGRIFVRTLLPKDATLEAVGGPGKEFLADGVNYAIDAGPSQYIIDKKYPIGQIDYDEVPELMGRWRMEVKPGSARRDDLFLHLIQVGNQSLDSMCDAECTLTSETAEIRFNTGTQIVTLSFSTTGDVGGHIRIERDNAPVIDQPLTQSVLPQEGLASLS